MGLIKIHDGAFHLRITRIVEQIWHFPALLSFSAQRIGVGVVEAAVILIMQGTPFIHTAQTDRWPFMMPLLHALSHSFCSFGPGEKVRRSSSLARSCLVKCSVKMIKRLIVNSVGTCSVRHELCMAVIRQGKLCYCDVTVIMVQLQ